jgi:hypothetical protein
MELIVIKILDRDLNVIAKSRNLRGIVARSRSVQPTRVDVYLDERHGKGQLGVTWEDESFVITDFASSKVLEDYVHKCQWKRGAQLVIHRRIAA